MSDLLSRRELGQLVRALVASGRWSLGGVVVTPLSSTVLLRASDGTLALSTRGDANWSAQDLAGPPSRSRQRPNEVRACAFAEAVSLAWERRRCTFSLRGIRRWVAWVTGGEVVLGLYCPRCPVLHWFRRDLAHPSPDRALPLRSPVRETTNPYLH